jgi:hypothetical protein
MTRNSYRAAFERLRADFTEARQAGAEAETVERSCRALDAFVASMASDPRKLRWVAEESPSCAAEIQQWAAQISMPRQVLDPTHDGAYARLWAASLGDETLGMLRAVLQAESARRPLPRR